MLNEQYLIEYAYEYKLLEMEDSKFIYSTIKNYVGTFYHGEYVSLLLKDNMIVEFYDAYSNHLEIQIPDRKIFNILVPVCINIYEEHQKEEMHNGDLYPELKQLGIEHIGLYS